MNLAKSKTKLPAFSKRRASLEHGFPVDITLRKTLVFFPLLKEFASIALVLILSFSARVVAANNDNKEDESPRWFEIEVILYKSTSEDGITNESWSRDVILALPSQKMDFLQPFTEPELEIELSDNPDLLEENRPTNTNSIDKSAVSSTGTGTGTGTNNVKDNASDPEYISSSLLSETDFTTEELPIEKPFLLLDKSYLQLSDEAQRIERNRKYTLVSHFSWRQPVGSKKEGVAVRLAGGKDHSELFKYNGSKKIERLPTDLNIADNEFINSVLTKQETEHKLDQPLEITMTDSPTKQDENDVEQLYPDTLSSVDSQEFIPVALPWVPEIDGSMLVYIYRNYLHIDADLYYRTPGKEKISALNLSNNFSSSEANFETPSLESEHSVTSFSQRSLEQIKLENPLEPIDPQTLDNSYQWQFDSNFLNQESDQIYLTRLINYPLKQTRRLRSGELHYFDHPLIGMLVIIRPYELESETETETEDKNEVLDISNK